MRAPDFGNSHLCIKRTAQPSRPPFLELQPAANALPPDFFELVRAVGRAISVEDIMKPWVLLADVLGIGHRVPSNPQSADSYLKPKPL